MAVYLDSSISMFLVRRRCGNNNSCVIGVLITQMMNSRVMNLFKQTK
jgi:hypothetical protein